VGKSVGRATGSERGGSFDDAVSPPDVFNLGAVLTGCCDAHHGLELLSAKANRPRKPEFYASSCNQASGFSHSVLFQLQNQFEKGMDNTCAKSLALRTRASRNRAAATGSPRMRNQSFPSCDKTTYSTAIACTPCRSRVAVWHLLPTCPLHSYRLSSSSKQTTFNQN
jgi:hypothetical protein